MSVLQEEGAQVTGECPDGIRPLRVLLLNLMPNKAVTELDIARVLAVPDMDVQLLPMKIAGQTYKTTPMSHMERFYADFEHFEHDHFDGFIITGAPVEHLPFEEVRYWPQLCHIMDWARTHVRSTLYICWGAQGSVSSLRCAQAGFARQVFRRVPATCVPERISFVRRNGTVFPHAEQPSYGSAA